MSWLKRLGLAAIGILAIAVTFLKSRVERLKREKVEQELEDEKAATQYANNATEAVLRGVANENKKTDRNKHDFIDFS